MSFLDLLFKSGGELFLRDLTVVVGVDHVKDLVGFCHGDTYFLGSDSDGGGGGDEGNKGEFHFGLFFIFNYYSN